ncbi:diguanylate cyclase [Marinobacter nauticus]
MNSTVAGDDRAPSLIVRVMLAMISVILLVFLLHAVYVYTSQRAEIIDAMSGDINESLQRLSENIAPFMAAYSVNEYEKLVATETALKEHFAVVVKDRKMGEIIGEPYYVSGRVRSEEGGYVAYQKDNAALNERLAQAYMSDTTTITSADREVLGQVSVYASNAPLVAKLHKVIVEEILTILVLSVALSLLLLAVLRRYFLRSVQRIDSAIKRCDEEGVPLQPVPDLRYREIRGLSQTINTMLESIKESRAKREIESIRLENTITGTHAGTWEWNVSTGETVFNERWAEIVGYSLAELAPISIETWASLAHPEDFKRSGELLDRHFRGELPYYECEARMRHKNGHWVWVLDRGCLMTRTDDGAPLMMYGTHQDITDRKEAEKKLSMAAGVFKYARDGIVITSAGGTILDVNDAFTQLTGYARSDVVHQDYSLLSSDRHADLFYKAMLKSLDEEGVWSGEYWMPCQNGAAFPSLMTIAAVRNGDGDVEHYVTLVADISNLKQNEDKLRLIAHYDNLTGLPNRILLTERLRHATLVARRRKEELAVVFMDLDGFKEVNDTFGHAAGDQLLTILADRMKYALRECDTVARLGGDEFVVLLPDLSGKDDCRQVLDRLLVAVSAPACLGEGQVQVSASIGVSLYPQQQDVDADTLLRQADMAMYHAKQHGKNQYYFFQSVDTPMLPVLPG